MHYGTAPLIDGVRDKRPSQQRGSANGPIGGTVPLDPLDKSVPPWDGTGRAGTRFLQLIENGISSTILSYQGHISSLHCTHQ